MKTITGCEVCDNCKKGEVCIDYKNELCAYCGEDKWENQDKHLSELKEFLSKAATALGSIRTKKKALSSKRNGKLGGRPPKP